MFLPLFLIADCQHPVRGTLRVVVARTQQMKGAAHSPSKLNRLDHFTSASKMGTLEPSGTPSSSLPLSSAFCSWLLRFSSLLRLTSASLISALVLVSAASAAAFAASDCESGSEDLRPGSLSSRFRVRHQPDGGRASSPKSFLLPKV